MYVKRYTEPIYRHEGKSFLQEEIQATAQAAQSCYAGSILGFIHLWIYPSSDLPIPGEPGLAQSPRWSRDLLTFSSKLLWDYSYSYLQLCSLFWLPQIHIIFTKHQHIFYLKRCPVRYIFIHCSEVQYQPN